MYYAPEGEWAAEGTCAQGNRWARTAAVRYAIAAAGCLAFALIYAQFSHGVHSPFMSYMFLIPLLAGAGVAGVLGVLRKNVSALARQLWALGIAVFTVASTLRGIFEIAGTASPWLWAYVVAGAALAIAAVASAAKRD